MLAGLATGASVSKLDLDVVFLITLVPLVGAGVVAFAFRASMMATEFNRRGIESMLLVAFAISANHGLTLRLAHDATIVFCTDLVIVAGFLFGTAVYARDRLMAVAAAVALTGAAAIASAPAQAAPIFAIATATLLPFLYFHWTSKGAS